MPLQQVSVPYRGHVWIQWPEWYFAHHTISKSVVLSPVQCMQRLFRCLSALVLTIITTPVSLKEKKIRLFIHNLQVVTFVLVAESHSSWQAFPNQTPNVMSLYWRVSQHMSTWPSGSEGDLTPCPLRWLWLPYLPTEEEGGGITYPVISCGWYCTRKTAVVKLVI